jgi:predicted nucleic acid-binding Zn finger protein
MSGEKPSCYHILAVKKAVKEETYSIVEREDTSYKKMLEDLLKEGDRTR